MIYNTQFGEKVYNIINDVIIGMGYEVVRIRLLNSNKDKILQIMLDKSDDCIITIGDCQQASSQIYTLLDVEGLSEKYVLEVSSTGVNKPLTRKKDFIYNVGKTVKLSTKTIISGRSRFEGNIIKFKDNIVTISLLENADNLCINYDDIVTAQLKVI